MVDAIGYILAILILIFACQFVVAVFALPVILTIHFYKRKTQNTEKAKLNELKRERHVGRLQNKNARQMRTENRKQMYAFQRAYKSNIFIETEKIKSKSQQRKVERQQERFSKISIEEKAKLKNRILTAQLQKINEQKKSIDSMSGIEFENIIAKVFQLHGYQVATTPKTGDFGADLILYLQNRKVCIQCKRYSKPVGVKAVQEVASARKYYECDSAAVITNSHFTEQAKLLAKSNDVELIDGNWVYNQYKLLLDSSVRKELVYFVRRNKTLHQTAIINLSVAELKGQFNVALANGKTLAYNFPKGRYTIQAKMDSVEPATYTFTVENEPKILIFEIESDKIYVIE